MNQKSSGHSGCRRIVSPGRPGHVFYDKLNRLVAENGLVLFVEQLCQLHGKTGSRPSITPGLYFRMLMIGYLEGIDSQHGIAWRREDSLALR